MIALARYGIPVWKRSSCNRYAARRSIIWYPTYEIALKNSGFTQMLIDIQQKCRLCGADYWNRSKHLIDDQTYDFTVDREAGRKHWFID